MAVMSGIGVMLGFALLAVGAWKKANLIIVTMAVTAIIGLFGGLSVAKVWTGPYVQGFTSFAGNYLLLFCFGALFGKILEDSGAGWRVAKTIATKAGDRWALATFCAITLLLMYGGVSVFVIVFFTLPIAKSLFMRLRIPWSYFPGIGQIGMMPAVAMLPGSLQLLNAMPTKYFGTTLTTGAGIGLMATALYIVMAYLYTKWILRRSESEFNPEEFKAAQSADFDEAEMDKKAPSAITSIIPIAVALILINVLKLDIVQGLLIASVCAIILFRKSLPSNIWNTVNTGVTNGVLPLVNVSVVVGIAKTVAAVPFFEVMKNAVLRIPVSGLIKVMAVTNIMSAMTGSSSGSMSMILELFGKEFLSWGYSPDLLHRLITVASVGLDSLPWNSVIVGFFTLSGVTYARGYKHVFAYTVIMPIICAIVMAFAAPLFYH